MARAAAEAYVIFIQLIEPLPIGRARVSLQRSDYWAQPTYSRRFESSAR
jgi:hypothetical protein